MVLERGPVFDIAHVDTSLTTSGVTMDALGSRKLFTRQ